MAKKKTKRARQQAERQKGQRRARLLWGGVAMAVLLVVAAFVELRQPDTGGGETADDLRIAPEVGAVAPDFELVSYQGETLRLSDFRGQPVAVMFMHTW